MNFLYRTQPVVPELPSVQAEESDLNKDLARKSSGTLEGLIANEDRFPGPGPGETDSDGPAEVAPGRPASRNELPAWKHVDVAEGEGWITIPNKELPDDWNEVSDITELKSLDRSFIFPGEQVHILVCFSPSEESELISPFKSVPSISKNGKSIQNGESNGQTNGSVVSPPIISQTDDILGKFKNSSFFARIAELDDPLWSRKKRSPAGNSNSCNVVSDKGFFDGVTAGGVARDSVRCFSLKNGDIVVLLRVNVGVTNQIPVQSLEILQFEKHESPNNNSESNDPFGNLLTWLLPLDRTLPPPRSFSPPVIPPTVSHKPSFSASSTSQIFSFGNFRSYSMPTTVTPPSGTLPTVTPTTVTSTAVTASPTESYDLEEFDSVALERSISKGEMEGKKLSFRGVQLETERYSVRCGLEGIYLPGKRWKKRVEIVQPVEVSSFAAKCSTENLLCVQVKNVAPEHLSDIVIYIDAITIVFEEASKGGSSMPLSLPISSIESGDGHSLPNLALRRNEEHSFILKPATRVHVNNATNHKLVSSSVSSITDQYAVLVSYHCNYSESKLFFKQATSWRPSVARDVMISVSSEPCNQVGQSTRVPQLPVQVLTLEATNLTAEDLTLTVLAPEPSTSSPSVLALNAAPATNLAASSFSTTSSPNEVSASCTHLWLQSAVPLGCVQAQSSATVKLELLPLTDGIITLNTLQITIKEKGLTYVPEHSLEIYATSSISTGIS